ncbi:S-adenosyl-L-methionine-dependent methyltransferase [Amniculicola lignicola CBS 123094]|uniref:S-adenosyl-L-methionine-dependent methyltransferase n=1 Tax=Amniculicola lignicola CBS 123094 TaxID=1392246 RepID=A0A6A5W5A5_9PLEO|nr:S-adenosyl-L-methionine-dependent methyltransferase [Amniculicola lignicola CBS 123094]
MDIKTITKEIGLRAASTEGIPEADRLALLAACNGLRDSIENPVEKILRTTTSVVDASMLRLAVDMELLDIAAAENGPVTINMLAEKSEKDPVLIRRVVRVLANINLFTEIDIDTFAPTRFTFAFAKPAPFRDFIIQWIQKWQFAYQTEDHYFDWLAKRPRLQSAFNNAMSRLNAFHGKTWYQTFPVTEKLQVESPDRVVLVDVGGNRGHDLIELKKMHPNLQGRLLLEDLPVVVEDAATVLPEGIEKVGIDFLDPQPPIAKGAKAYYLKRILHNWPEKQATLILKNIKDAMAEDSILLISDGILPEKGVTLLQAQTDIRMLAFCSSLERTEKQWKELLGSAGFEVVKVWTGEGGEKMDLALLEAVQKKI